MIYNLILFLLLFIATLIGRLVIGNWLAPGIFYSFIWTVFTIVPLAFLGRENSLNTSGFLWIVFVAIIGIICNSFFKEKIHDAPLPGKSITYLYVNKNKLIAHHIVLFIFIVIGCLAPILSIFQYGFRLSSLTDVSEIADIGNTISIARYSELYEENIATKITKQFIYISPGIAGILYAIDQSRNPKILVLFSFVPALFWTTIQTTKTSILFSVITYLSWYLSVRIYIKREKRILVYFPLIKLLVSSCALFIVFFTSSAIRYKKFDPILIIERLINSFTAQLFLFSEWFGQNWNNLDGPFLGMYTFSGPYAILQQSERLIGLGYQSLASMGLESNIFTIHRGLIEDFHLIGAICFFLTLFLTSSFSFNRILAAKKMPHFYILILACSYSIILWSPITFIFTYNSMISTYIVIYLLFVILYKNEVYQKSTVR